MENFETRHLTANDIWISIIRSMFSIYSWIPFVFARLYRTFTMDPVFIKTLVDPHEVYEFIMEPYDAILDAKILEVA